MRPRQNTVGRPVELSGIGVHGGEPATLTVRPAEEDAGRVFARVDLPGSPEVPALLEFVAGTELCTSLSRGGVRVGSVEHALAALAALDVDNARLELDGPEAPIMDGSFLPYFEAVRDAGVEPQRTEARVLGVDEPVSVACGDGDASYVALPGEGLSIAATIDFEHPAIGRQHGAFAIQADEFGRELAGARTFGFRAEGEALRARGMARGAGPENTVVLSADGVEGALRFADEFVRHKVGDLVGDLALLGARAQARVVAERPGHAGNVALARALLERHRRSERACRIDVERVMRRLPHRYPMLLVDRIVELDPGRRIVGLKNVTINEPFFRGHFPGHPIMPGVLLVEAMGQVGGILLMDAVEDPDDKVVYFMSLDRVKWRRPVVPGDQVLFEVEMLKFRGRTCRMRGAGRVDGAVVAEAFMTARVVDR